MGTHLAVRVEIVTLAAFGLAPYAAAQSPAAAPIEEIVVVAQKREQLVQDIGIAVTAFSGRSLRERGIDQPADIYQLIPNVNLQNHGGGGAPVVIVRGVGLQSFRINDSPTTAFYVDDVYQTSVASAEWTMFDIERVEVLKGPQGGLYGRNALGGAVQIISRMPRTTEEREGYAWLGADDYSRREVEAAAGFALSERVAVRAAGRAVGGDDSPYRSVTGNFEHGAEERDALRFTVRIQPSDVVDVVVRVHGGKDDSELAPLRPLGVYANAGSAAGLGAPNVSLSLLAGLSQQLAAPLCASITAGRGADSAACATVTGVTPAGYGLVDTDHYASAATAPGFLDSRWSGGAVTAAWRLGDYRLESIASRDTIDYRRFQDFDGTPAEHLHIDYNTRINAWSQELRLSATDGAVSWLAGLSYAEDELTEATLLYGAQGVLPLLFFGATWSPQDYVQETEAWAAYGHAEWRVAEKLNVVSELRYTDEAKTFVGGARLGFADGSTAPFLATAEATSFEALSGKVGVEWVMRDDLLVYGSMARGFKTGGFFGGFPNSVEQLAPFDAETLWSYEIGVKSDWHGGRLRFNGSVYRYDREDVQQNAANPSGSINIRRINNIGDVDSVGAELDLIWAATTNLSLTVGLGTADAEVSESSFIQAATIPLFPDAPMLGSNLPNYARRTANVVGRYDGSLRGGLDYHVQLEGRYTSEQDLSVITNPLEVPVFSEPGYALWNLRLGLGAPNARWQAHLYVNNVRDERYRILARHDGAFGIHELFGMPRTLGFHFQVRWD